MKLKTYIFTIIAPAYHKEQKIVKCIEDRQQNSLSLEHVCVEYSLEDMTVASIQKHIEKNEISNVKIIRIESNAGPGSARNKALDIVEDKNLSRSQCEHWERILYIIILFWHTISSLSFGARGTAKCMSY